jgi:diguanylate cyclase (GGDEF)-like protein/PAS domain S-box-containing protein
MKNHRRKDEMAIWHRASSVVDDDSDYVRADDLLSPSGHFEAIVQSSHDAIISKTLDGIVTSWNPGAQTIFGYGEQEMLGQPLTRLFPPGREHEELFILEKIQNGEKIEHFETVRIKKDGSLIDVSVTISPIRDEQGRVVGASKIARDISNQVLLENAAERFRALVTSSDDAIISKSLQGIVKSWNAGAQRIFGYTAEEMIGQPLLRLFPADREHEELFILEQILAGKKVDHFDTIRVRKDGVHINVSVSISPIRDKQGRIVGASKIARDITQQKCAEENFKLTSSVFTYSSEGIAITDRHGVFIEVNEALTQISGYSREELLGKTYQMFRSGQQGPDVHLKMLSELRQTGNTRAEIWSRRKNGEPYTGLLTISAVQDQHGDAQKYVALFSDITPLRKQQEKLERLTNFDDLTDLPNRLLLLDRLRQAMLMSRHRDQKLAVLYLDLDGFKPINDEHGHDVGDALLIALSRRMSATLRDLDTMARIGGDEFVTVLVDIKSPEQLNAQLERILRACSDPIKVCGRLLQVSASVGVTTYPLDDVDEDQLIRHADMAMCDAKKNGKNRYQLFDAARDAKEKGRDAELRRLTQALNDEEFILHYQPKVNMRTGRIIGMEALIRWQHPQRGLLPPAEFLPLIEDHHLSDDIGVWVIGHALAQMDQWQKIGILVPVSVNLGPRQLQQEQFCATLTGLLQRYPHISPEYLELEILETSALHDIEAVSAIMQACRKLGVQFSIDDFGTGYSSLTYLRRLPAELLKIDQTFVRDMLNDHEDMAIVRGVIGLAEAFHRKVIAEGVETVAHGLKLLELGCELGQGYGISRPLPPEQLPQWMASWTPPAEWLG